jgi:hypothetical protein
MLLSQYSPSRRQEVFSLSQPGIAKSNRLDQALYAECPSLTVFGERDVSSKILHQGVP